MAAPLSILRWEQNNRDINYSNVYFGSFVIQMKMTVKFAKYI